MTACHLDSIRGDKMTETTLTQRVTSKEILDKTGISRATLNNYIKMGLLPQPVVGGTDSPQEKARRIGWFPVTVLDSIETIKQMKRQGLAMEEIAAKLGRAPKDETRAEEEPGPRMRGARLFDPSLKLTLDDIRFPAYLLNYDLEIEWVNSEAEEKIFKGKVRQIARQEDRNLFKLFFGWEFHENLENWEEIIAFHLSIVKPRIPKLLLRSLYPGISEREAELMEKLYDEVSPAPEQSINADDLSCVTRTGSRLYFRVFTVFFREGVFFVWVPADEGQEEIRKFLSCRRTVINELLKHRMPSLVNLCVLVADLQNSVKLSAELLPAEYFGLINGLWQCLEDTFEKYKGLHGRQAGDGVLYYFIQRPRSNYIMDALICALEIRERIKEFSAQWKIKKGWLNDLYLNIGLNEGQEFFGTIRSAANIEFTALGESINYAGRLSDFARFGAIWTTKALINKLSREEQEQIRFGVRRREHGREVFIENSFVRLTDLIDIKDERYSKFADIAMLPVTQIMDRG